MTIFKYIKAGRTYALAASIGVCQSACRQARYREAIERLQIPTKVNLYFTPLRQGLSQNPELFVCSTGWLARELPGSTCLPSPTLGRRSCSALLLDAGDLNLDPDACRVSAPTHRASSPACGEGLILTFIFILCESKIAKMPVRESVPHFHCVGPRDQTLVVSTSPL